MWLRFKISESVMSDYYYRKTVLGGANLVLVEASVGEEDAFTGEDYGSQFLNDSGEGVQEKENDREGEEVPITNSGEV